MMHTMGQCLQSVKQRSVSFKHDRSCNFDFVKKVLGCAAPPPKLFQRSVKHGLQRNTSASAKREEIELMTLKHGRYMPSPMVNNKPQPSSKKRTRSLVYLRGAD